MTRLLLRGSCSCSSLGLGGPAAAAEPGDEGMVPLFDGKSFAGWKKVGGGATYTIEGDTIVGKVGPGANSFLRTEKTYGDFVLKVDLKLDVPTNSGIQFRSHQQPSDDGNGRVYGYQCEVDPLPRAWSGGLYEEGRRLWLFPLEGHEEARKAFKLDDWNHFTISACGPHLRTWLNGVPCADLIDAMELEGFIALQVHAGKAGQIRFKNIRLKDLGQSTRLPLWDGTSLVGWTTQGPGQWRHRGRGHSWNPCQHSTGGEHADLRSPERRLRTPPQIQGSEGALRRCPGPCRRPRLVAHVGPTGEVQPTGRQEIGAEGGRTEGRLESVRRHCPGGPDRGPAQRPDDYRLPRRPEWLAAPRRDRARRRPRVRRRDQGHHDPPPP